MSRTAAALAVGALAGPALVALAAAVRPAPPSLASLRRRVHGELGVSAPMSAGGRAPLHRGGDALARTELGTWFSSRFSLDLRAAQLTVPEVFTKLISAAIAGAFVGILVVAAMAASGAGVSVAAAVGFAMAGGGFASLLVLRSVKAVAARKRHAFEHAVGQYVMLCASVMAGGRSAEWAARSCAALGEGTAFEVVNAALVAAPAIGRTTWDALDQVGLEYGIAELRDLASGIERATTLGADASEATSMIAQAMRTRSLDEVERAADRSNVRMLGPTYLFVAGFLALLAFPVLDTLSHL